VWFSGVAEGRKYFRDFLRTEFSEENVLFWLACEELKRETNAELVEEKARSIYEDYISILSPKEVHFSCSIFSDRLELIIILLLPRMIFIVLSIRREPHARVHFGSSERKSVSARWPPSCKLDL